MLCLHTTLNILKWLLRSGFMDTWLVAKRNASLPQFSLCTGEVPTELLRQHSTTTFLKTWRLWFLKGRATVCAFAVLTLGQTPPGCGHGSPGEVTAGSGPFHGSPWPGSHSAWVHALAETFAGYAALGKLCIFLGPNFFIRKWGLT